MTLLLALAGSYFALVLGVGGTLAVIHGVQYHEWGLAVAGAASALAVPLSGGLTLGVMRDRQSVSRWIPAETVMLGVGLTLSAGWVFYLTNW